MIDLGELKWFGHVVRMEDDKRPQNALAS